MSDNKPLIPIGPPDVGDIPKQQPVPQPKVNTPGAGKQGKKLGSRFMQIASALGGQRLSAESFPTETDPELVVVFDLAGSIDGFKNAVAMIEGLEFLNEYIDDEFEPDEEFYLSTRDGRIDRPLHHSLYVVMSNSRAIDDLIRMFRQWQDDEQIKFPHGLGRFKRVFAQLKDIRRWSASDRVRDTGLLEQWEGDLAVVGQSQSSVMVEIELFYRHKKTDRENAKQVVRTAIATSGGEVVTDADITSIAYHAVLARLPIQAIRAVLRDGVDAIELLNTDSIMFVSPYRPMSVILPNVVSDESVESVDYAPLSLSEEKPRIALLDGLPFPRHQLLSGRLIIDDPDGVGADYPVSSMHHGTAMASLILHGDYSTPSQPLPRPIYVRPILQPDAHFVDRERTPPDQLLPDLLHRAIRRIFEQDGSQEAQAPSVRIINLSIGVESRAFVRKISPLGRLLDWLAVTYNVLIVVSAGNHLNLPLLLDGRKLGTLEQARQHAIQTAYQNSRLRGILPPGEALNVLTIGATSADGYGEVANSDTVWDLASPNLPALYGATGPGFRRSVKPDIFFNGGRALYVRPTPPHPREVIAGIAFAAGIGPGIKTAAPGRGGETNRLSYSHGTSNATALVTREADRVFDILETLQTTSDGFDPPDPQYHPVLVRALLVHAASWNEAGSRLASFLNIPSDKRRDELTRQLGYGVLDTKRLATATSSRAVLMGASSIKRNQRHTFQIPKPNSIRARAEYHRITITLASMTPTSGNLQRYRGARVFFQKPDEADIGGPRFEAEWRAARNGTCQHEVFEGTHALAFDNGDAWQIHIDCRDDALTTTTPIRYGIVVSVEVAATTSELIHEEIQQGLRIRKQVWTAQQIKA